MKRIVLIIGISIICALALGCAQQNDDKIDLEKMTAGEILNVLTEQGYPMVTKVEFNEKGDASEYPWSIEGCTSAVTWVIPDGAIVSGGSGAIEVYETSGKCKIHRDSLAGLSAFSLANKYYLQVENVLLHVPQSLSEQEALQYQAALQAMAQGKLPEPYVSE